MNGEEGDAFIYVYVFSSEVKIVIMRHSIAEFNSLKILFWISVVEIDDEFILAIPQVI